MYFLGQENITDIQTQKKKGLNLIMSINNKISQLLEKKKKIDDEIEKLKVKNTETLATALCKISDIEKLDPKILIGAVLEVVKNISDDKTEVLAKAGSNFLRQFKIKNFSTKTPRAKKKQNN